MTYSLPGLAGEDGLSALAEGSGLSSVESVSPLPLAKARMASAGVWPPWPAAKRLMSCGV